MFKEASLFRRTYQALELAQSVPSQDAYVLEKGEERHLQHMAGQEKTNISQEHWSKDGWSYLHICIMDTVEKIDKTYY